MGNNKKWCICLQTAVLTCLSLYDERQCCNLYRFQYSGYTWWHKALWNFKQ